MRFKKGESWVFSNLGYFILALAVLVIMAYIIIKYGGDLKARLLDLFT